MLGRAVELLAINESAFVIHGHSVVALGNWAAAFLEDLVLEFASGAIGEFDGLGFDTGFLFVFSEEGFAFFLVLFGGKFASFFTLCCHVLPIGIEPLPGLLFGQFQVM